MRGVKHSPVAGLLPERLASRVVAAENGCWLWTGPLLRNGYAVVWWNGKNRSLHRLVYCLTAGRTPTYTLDHDCHNRDATCPGGVSCRHRACCRPDHLSDVPRGVNTLNGRSAPALNLEKAQCKCGRPYSHVDRKGWRKCRHCERERSRAASVARGALPPPSERTHCPKGHLYDEKNTRITTQGARACRTCENVRRRRPPRGMKAGPEVRKDLTREYEEGGTNCAKLAAKYGLSPAYVYRIVKAARG